MEAILRRRLAQVPRDRQALLHLAAVAGRELDLAILDRLKDSNDLEDWLAICAECAVLEVQEGHWRFAHDKLRQAALEAIPGDLRAGYHRQVAEAIEGAYPDTPEQASILAQHWRAAGDLHQEWVYAQRAGDYALRISSLPDAVANLSRALELLPMVHVNDGDNRGLEADLMMKLGEALGHLGDYPKAVERLEAALDLCRELSDQAGEAHALNLLANLHWQHGNFAPAASNAEASLGLCRALNDPRGIVQALNSLGMVAQGQGNYEVATAYLTEGIEVIRAIDDPQGVATTVNNLGLVAYTRGDYANAAQYFEETLAIARASGERRKAATALMNLGVVGGIQGNYANAAQYFEETLAICRTIGNRRGAALALHNLGYLANLQGEFTAAQRYGQESLAIYRAIGNRRGVTDALMNLGHVARSLGEQEQALENYYEALRVADEIKDLPTIMEILTGLAGVISDISQAAELVGLVSAHKATSDATHKMADTVVSQMRMTMSEDSLNEALERAKSLDLNTVVADLLAKREP
jgi:tetratricopeptide (TPR) repeat protein